MLDPMVMEIICCIAMLDGDGCWTPWRWRSFVAPSCWMVTDVGPHGDGDRLLHPHVGW